MPHATMPSPGLQALILCGPGVSLNTFTSNPKDLPKALVPIANRPMVWYPLDWCHRMGITDITLLVPPESEPALKSALHTHPALTSLPSPKADVLAPSSLTPTTGTCELLRLPEVQKRITSDFLLLPCDLVSEVSGTALLQQWLTMNPQSSNGGRRKGGLAVFYPTLGREGISHKKDETDFIATTAIEKSVVPPAVGSLRAEVETLVLSLPADTLKDKVEANGNALRLRVAMTRKYGKVKLKTKHRDAHVYFLPKWVKEFAARNERFESVGEDLVGWWAKAQWQDGLGARLGLDEICVPEKRSGGGEDSPREMEEEVEIDPAALSTTKASLASSHRGQDAMATRFPNSSANPNPTPSLLAYIQPSPSPSSPTPTLIRRIDTTHALLATSLHLATLPYTSPLAHSAATRLHPSHTTGQYTRIASEDCLVDANTSFGARCVIKTCVIGANCTIGEGVRLTRCLLMDGVVVGDGVAMVGCTVGRRARIEGGKAKIGVASAAGGKGKGKARAGVDEDEGRAKLTDCEVAPGFVVEAGVEVRGEKMMGFDTGVEMGGVDDDDDDNDE